MELYVKEGKYQAAPGGGLRTVTGVEELAQRIVMKLTCRRGAFSVMPDYGSRLYTLPALRASSRKTAARAFVDEALAGEKGLTLTDLTVAEDGQGRMDLDLYFKAGSEAFSVNLSI